ncbi:MAG: hypothetical protein ACKOLZ_08320 [Verrucomicrobiota bacterium]
MPLRIRPVVTLAVLAAIAGCGTPAARPGVARWEAALGRPATTDWKREQRLEESFVTPDFSARLYRQRTGSRTEQLVLLMIPHGLRGRAPGVVVPFYDPDRMCGYDLRSKTPLGPERNSAKFGLHLVRQGYVVAAAESYPYNVLTEQEVSKATS